MKPLAKNSSFILILFMLAITCSKEKEENPTVNGQETFEVIKASNKATANWKRFNSTAEKLLAITATNLKSLGVMREKTLIVGEQQSLFLIYSQSKNQYTDLKKRLAAQNAAFKKDIINYSKETEAKYVKFSDEFLTELIDLNNNLEDLIDEVQTGPMK